MSGNVGVRVTIHFPNSLTHDKVLELFSAIERVAPVRIGPGHGYCQYPGSDDNVVSFTLLEFNEGKGFMDVMAERTREEIEQALKSLDAVVVEIGRYPSARL